MRYTYVNQDHQYYVEKTLDPWYQSTLQKLTVQYNSNDSTAYQQALKDLEHKYWDAYNEAALQATQKNSLS